MKNVLPASLPSSLPAIPLDILGVIVFLAVLFGVFMYFRKPTAIAFTISPFLAGFLFESFPYVTKIESLAKTDAQKLMSFLVLYLVLFLLSFFCVRRITASVYPQSSFMKSIEAALLAFFSAGSIFLVLWKVVHISTLSKLAPSLGSIFSTSGILFWWGIGTLFLLIFLARE